MSISERDKQEIAEVVLMVLDARLDQLQKEIVAGFVECIDWHNDNFAKIIATRNDAVLAKIAQNHQDRIEINTQREAAQQLKDKQISERLGFTSKSTASPAQTAPDQSAEPESTSDTD